MDPATGPLANTPEELSRSAEASLAARRAKSNARLTKLFTALTLLVGVVVVGAVAYDIYLHPAAPKPVGTAVIKISGTAPFQGEIGTLNRYGTHTIKGTAPARVEVPYGRADYVIATMELSSGPVEICLEHERLTKTFKTIVTCNTVEKSSANNPSLMWKAPLAELP